MLNDSIFGTIMIAGTFIKRITRCKGCRTYSRSTSRNFSKL